MNIEDIAFTNKHELEQVEKYGYIVVGDSAVRAKEMQWLLSERERLAAENAELRETVTETEQACNELSDELSQMHQLELEAKCHGDLEESHKIMVDVVVERDAELAAANATLDALRERLPEYDTGPEDWEFGDLMRCVADFHNILYPQPKETTDDNER